jgi:predicted permease
MRGRRRQPRWFAGQREELVLADSLAGATRELARAIRRLAHAPLFVVIVIVTLGVGIGANATVLGIVDKLFFRRLPVPNPSQIVAVYSVGHGAGRARANANTGWSSFSDFLELRNRLGGVSALSAYSMAFLTFGDPVDGNVWSALVSGDYFATLETRPQLGRLLAMSDEIEIGGPPAVVISDHLWRSRFGGDPAIVGRRVRLGPTDCVVVGVAARDFTGMHPEGRTDLWVAFTRESDVTGAAPTLIKHGARRAMIIGRLGAHTTPAALETSLATASHDMNSARAPGQAQTDFQVAPHARLLDVGNSPEAVAMMAFVYIMVGLVTFVAVSNISSLMLSRLAATRQELGIRLCLGASRRRVVLHSLLEVLILVVPGILLGLLLTRWMTIAVTSAHFMSALDPGINGRIVTIVCVIAAIIMVHLSLIPALEARRLDPVALVRGDLPTRSGRRDRGSIIVLSQVIIAAMLLVNTCALLDVFMKQRQAKLGYSSNGLAVVSIVPRRAGGESTTAASGYDEVMARARAVPGVTAVSAAIGAPLFKSQSLDDLHPDGRPRFSPRQYSLQTIGPNYFGVLGVRLISGREFTNSDRAAKTGGEDRFDVIVVNEALAEQLWPRENALGKRLALGSRAVATVVGVVPTIRDASAIRDVPRAYVPLLESNFDKFELLVRGDRAPEALSPEIDRELRDLPLILRPSVRSLAGIVADAATVSRAALTGFAISAALTLLLTGSGLYGLVTMWASRRQREIAIRLAIGAEPRHVYALVNKEIAALLVTGSILGGLCGLGLVQIERAVVGPYLAVGVGAGFVALLCLVVIGCVAVAVPVRAVMRTALAGLLRTA